MAFCLDYLQASSIHGLRYIAEARGTLLKAVWLFCILTSFVTAVVIIYLNVSNWENSPSTITQATPRLIKEESLSMPMLTVCPKTQSFTNLITGYVRKYNETFVGSEMHGHLITRLGQQRYMDRVHKEWDMIDNTATEFTPLNICQGDKFTEPCRLIRLFSSVYTSQRDTGTPCLYHETQGLNSIIWYLLDDVFPQEIQPTNEGYKARTRTIEDCLELSEESALPEDEGTWKLVLKTYAVAFPVVKEVLSNGTLTLHDFKSFKDFNSAGAMHEDIVRAVQKDAPKLLEHLIKSGSVGKFVNAVSVHDVFVDIASRLGYYDFMPVTYVTQLINYFSHGSLDDLMLTNTLRALIIGCNSSVPHMTCHDTELIEKAGCKDYCDLIEHLLSMDVTEDLIGELLDMANYDINEMEEEKLSSLLPICNWNNKNGCWSKVITDRGLCYTNYDKDEKNIIVETGPTESHEFLMDSVYDGRVSNLWQGISAYNESWTTTLWSSDPTESYDILVTPRGDFSIPRTALKQHSIVKVLRTTRSNSAYYKVKIKPTVIVRTTDDFRAMSVKRRRCYYSHEVKLGYYPEYSEANCILECAWKEAAKICGCVPWFLKDHFLEKKMCEVFGNMCFRDVIDRRYETKEKPCYADCLEDCEKVEFQLEATKKSFRPYGNALTNYKFYCNSGVLYESTGETFEQKKVMCDYSAKKYLALNSTLGPYLDIDPNLRHNLKKSALTMVITSTMTTIDMVSNIGGTLGLFSGFSILSGIEIIYWVWRLLAERRSSKKKANRNVQSSKVAHEA